LDDATEYIHGNIIHLLQPFINLVAITCIYCNNFCVVAT
jgi:hypothetical protein